MEELNPHRQLESAGDKFCMNLLYLYPIDELIPGLPPNDIGILMVLSGVLNVVMSLLTVIWIKSKEKEAQSEEGGEDAAKSVIFPVFVQVLWINIATNLYSGAVETFVPYDPIGKNSVYVSILYSAVYGFRHLVIEGLAFLLMQKGCGKHAAKEAGRQAILWGVITYFITYVTFYRAGEIGKLLTTLLDVFVCCFYFVLWLAPLERLYRRPAAVFYSKFWAICRLLAVIVNVLDFFESTDDISACGYIFVNLGLFAIIQPVFCYWTLLLDSRWWQGIEIYGDDRTRTASYENIRAPLIGSDFSLTTAQSLAATMDRIRVQGQVKMLNFACIKIDFRQHLGAGSFSKVYRGTYRGKSCAIKLIYTVDLTADVIQRVAAEASILSSIRHPNIVNILGVSVLPPSVCLLLELCDFGSLSDIIRGYGFDWNTTHRSPLTLNRLDVLHFALGCARGLAAVHTYDKSICHRDVKSFNFLVDSQFTVKIADLELGVLRSKEPLNPTRTTTEHSFSRSGGHDELMSAMSDPNIVVVEELLANWMAPDVIINRRYQQASDVFSLGTVLWEIVSKELPFDGETQPEIRKKLLTGYKHPLPEHIQNTAFGDLIERCWEYEPIHRPKASEVVDILEDLLKNAFQQTITKHPTTYVPNFSTLRDFYEAAYRKSSNFLQTGTTSSKKSGASATFFRIVYHFLAKSNPMNWFSNDPNRQHSDNNNEWDEQEDSILLGGDTTITTRNSEVQAMTRNSEGLAGTGGGNVTFQTLDHSVSASSSRSVFNFSFRNTTHTNNTDGSEYISPNYLSKKNMLNIIMPPAAIDAIRLVKQEKYWYELESSDEAWAIFSNEYPYILIHATSRWYELFNVPSSFGIDYQLLSLVSLLYPEMEAMNVLCTSSNTYIQTAMNTQQFREMRITTTKEILQQLKKKNNVPVSSSFSIGGAVAGGAEKDPIHGIVCLHLPYMNRNNRSSSLSTPKKSAAATQQQRKQSRINSIGTEDELEGEEIPSYSVDTSGRVLGHNMMCSIHAYPVYPPHDFINVDLLLSSNHHFPANQRTISQDSSNTTGRASMPGASPSKTPFIAPITPIAINGKDGTRKKGGAGGERMSETLITKSPMYFAILFNELREQDPQRQISAAPSAVNSSQGAVNRFNTKSSLPLSDVTMTSAGGGRVIDLTGSKDVHEKGVEGEEDDEEDQNVFLQRYYSNEFDEIYDTTLDKRQKKSRRHAPVKSQQESSGFWNLNISRFWTFNNHTPRAQEERKGTEQQPPRSTKGNSSITGKRVHSVA